MLTAILTSDNHLGAYYARLRPDRLERRRQHLQEGFRRVVDAAIHERADLFLHAGDLFDRPDPRNAERRFVAEQFQRLREAGIPTFAIAGNHDCPRSYGYDGGVAPLEEVSALGGARLFRRSDNWDAETFLARGQRVCVRGMSSDFNRPAETCPLTELAASDARGGDIDLALLHYGVEGWGDFALEPSLCLVNLERLQTDAIAVGHLHTRNTRRLAGGALLLNPGATEHIRFGEEALECGYWRLHCAPGTTEAEYVALPTQPMQTLDIDVGAGSLEAAAGEGEEASETTQRAALHDALRRKIAAHSRADQMLRVRLKGRLHRDRFAELDIAALQAGAGEANFHCQFETDDLALYDEIADLHIEFGFSFDVRQELQRAVDALLPQYQDDPEKRDVALRAGRALDEAFDRLSGGAR